jgi:hypothetical protein
MNKGQTRKPIEILFPLCFSIALHGALVFLISQVFFTPSAPLVKKPPLQAKLYFPPHQEKPLIQQREATQNLKTEETSIEVSEQVVDDMATESKMTAEASTEVSAELTAQRTPEPVAPPSTEQKSESRSVQPKPVDIREATRRALSTIHSQNMETTFEAELNEYRSRDSRIIQNAPRQAIVEGPIDNQPKAIPVTCASKTKETLITVNRSLFGGRIRCRSYSADDIKAYIDKQHNKGQEKLGQNNEKSGENN